MPIARPGPPRRRRALPDDPAWFRDVVLYELRVRSFMDGNGDGIGDFAGLTSRLDYLEDLGVTALWLLPFYPSPGRDDGYDIADYTDVHPELGTLDDVRRFLDEAHARGIRVVTELVLNHTSEQHPWFQRARRAPPGSPERAFYVWSDTPEKYAGTRIIFKDFEPSNWSWDPVAKAYFWHRFYAHQPDLNFDNPAVHDALFSVVDFWLGLGVDGLRLDAVPYLYEREGTSCENLPETHAFLKVLRARVDARFPNRMLLAEANQWPEDAAAYFGDDDECHMNFHFPIMPRLYMAIHMEDRFPILDIVEQTPALSERCQWALFLRNHDELTLEMVTEEERDYMWRAFAHEPAMRINLGIRRRLAPLVGNDRPNIQLMNALLFSLPGTPVLYYGDELGMGDNVYLGDRNGVRTPMQWTAGRNAGFSEANPQRLVLPVIIDPAYHFESVNVEAQQNDPSSLLWWTKRLIALRKRFRAFGRGTLRFLAPENPRILAFLREHEGERILVVANLSRHVQYAELDLAELQGMTPVELFGRTRFPRVGELPYLLTLGGHAFYWFSLEWPESAAARQRAEAYEPPLVEVDGPIHALLGDAARPALEATLLRWIGTRPWFGRPEPAAVSLVDVVAIELGVHLVFVRVDVALREAEPWLVALAVADAERAPAVRARAAHAVIAEVAYVDAATGPARGLAYDAVADADTSASLLRFVASGARASGASGELVGVRLATLTPDAAELPARSVRGEAVHATVAFGERWFLALSRRLQDGPGPDVELGRFLYGAARPTPTAPLVGWLEYRTRRGEEGASIASVHAWVPHETDARAVAAREVGRQLERRLTQDRDRPVPPHAGHLVELARQPAPAEVADMIGAALDLAALLGRRTAELHAALASSTEPAFAPEPFNALYQRSMYQNLRNLVGAIQRALQAQAPLLAPRDAAAARAILASRGRLLARSSPLLDVRLGGARTRHHGDLHLGSWLHTGRDVVAIGFVGPLERPLADRRRKHSPLRDVAAMITSFREVASSALLDPSLVRDTDRPIAEAWTAAWSAWTSATYLRAYLEAAGRAPVLPADPAQLRVLLDALTLERAMQEVLRRLGRDGEPLTAALLGLAHELA